MARKARNTQDASSDDESPEIVSHSTSKADAKRNQKVLRDFEAEEKARRKARNRERDQKLKERAHVTRGGKAGKKVKGVRFLEGEGEVDGGEDKGVDDELEARMLRAMRDAADEVESVEGGVDDDDDDGLKGFGQEMDLGDDIASDLDASSSDDEDYEDAEMSPGGDNSIDTEALTDDQEMDEDEEDDETTPFQGNILRSNRKIDYLADDIFAAAFASQNSKPTPQKKTESTQQQAVKKRRRKSIAHPKDLVVGGRTIRTLLQLSDPRSQPTARSIPSARARRFLDHSLAMKGKKALLKANKKGWERRPANVGVMKYQGAPHGFARSTR